MAHALRTCNTAKEVWQQLNYAWDTTESTQGETRDWIQYKVQGLNLKQLQELVITLWMIWNARNGELQGEERKPATVIAKSVTQYIAEFNAAQEKLPGNIAKPVHQWRPPTAGVDRWRT